MFKTLEIKNFKSIGHAVFDLGSINVLTGHSNLGKSNVVQAIYCLVHNSWDSGYLKWGEKKCSIRLTDETGEWVEYQHDQTSASYQLSTIVQPFVKIGKSVPTEVESFLNMNLVQFDEDLKLDFNFERQFDPAFVISLSGFELAKVFGKLMNLDIVLSASRNIAKDVQALNRKKDSLTAIQDVSVDFIRNGYTIELKYALLHQALSLDAKAEQMDSVNEKLGSIIADVEYYAAVAKTYQEFLNSDDMKQLEMISDPIPGLGDILVGLEVANAQVSVYGDALSKEMPTFDFELYKGLSEVLISSEQEQDRAEIYQYILTRVNDIDFDVVNNLQSLLLITNQVDQYNQQVQALNVNMSGVSDQITAKQTEFSNYLKENNVCPITHQPFMAGCVDRILSEA